MGYSLFSCVVVEMNRDYTTQHGLMTWTEAMNLQSWDVREKREALGKSNGQELFYCFPTFWSNNRIITIINHSKSNEKI